MFKNWKKSQKAQRIGRGIVDPRLAPDSLRLPPVDRRSYWSEVGRAILFNLAALAVVLFTAHRWLVG